MSTWRGWQRKVITPVLALDRPHETRTHVDPEPGLRVATVMAHPDLDARRQPTATELKPPPRALQPEPQPQHVVRALRTDRFGLTTQPGGPTVNRPPAPA